MPDLRVNAFPHELIFALNVMALDKQKTLRQLIIDTLSAATTKHNYGTKSPKKAGASQ